MFIEIITLLLFLIFIVVWTIAVLKIYDWYSSRNQSEPWVIADSSSTKQTTDVIVQSQCNYQFYKATPRFNVLPPGYAGAQNVPLNQIASNPHFQIERPGYNSPGARKRHEVLYLQ